jgi:hypothetical protein
VTDIPSEREARLLPVLERHLDAAMRALDAYQLAEGDEKIADGREPEGIFVDVVGDELVATWAGFEILRIRRELLRRDV